MERRWSLYAACINFEKVEEVTGPERIMPILEERNRTRRAPRYCFGPRFAGGSIGRLLARPVCQWSM